MSGCYRKDFLCITVWLPRTTVPGVHVLKVRWNSFSLRVIDSWNALPENVVMAPYFNCFKSRLNTHWKKKQKNTPINSTLGATAPDLNLGITTRIRLQRLFNLFRLCELHVHQVKTRINLMIRWTPMWFEGFVVLRLIYQKQVEHGCAEQNEPRHDKTNSMSVHPAKTQISLGIQPVWSESSLSAWRNLGSLATHWAHGKNSDQTVRMPRLIWVFAGRTIIWLVLSCCGSNDKNTFRRYVDQKMNKRFSKNLTSSQYLIVIWYRVAICAGELTFCGRYHTSVTDITKLDFTIKFTGFRVSVSQFPYLIRDGWRSLTICSIWKAQWLRSDRKTNQWPPSHWSIWYRSEPMTTNGRLGCRRKISESTATWLFAMLSGRTYSWFLDWFSDVSHARTLPLKAYMSRDMTKPTKWLCVQRRLRSAWASA